MPSDAFVYQDLNVGREALVDAQRIAGVYHLLEVTNGAGASVPVPELWAVEPASGEPLGHVKVIGSGLGANAAAYNGVIKLRDSDATVFTCTVVTWTRVAGDPTQAFPLNVEHEEVVISVPQAVDGDAAIYAETNA